ncbi:MAG: serine/threonine-protein kinase PknK, partial [Sandaracinaceae bacterium]
WRARSRGVAGFEKTVVIKRVLPALLERPGFAELLVREAKIAAGLSHPNIIQIFDLGEEQGSYFIAMEYLRGRDLATALSLKAASGEESLPLALRLHIGAEVAKALDYAHRAKGPDGKPMNIVHRDVSPQNVLLGFEGEVKVADFGIARADPPDLGKGEDPKILRGKYAYMSPEQARGEALDKRSDIFSLGIMLFELTTARRMFRGRASTDVLAAVRAGQLPDWQSHVESHELAAIIGRALAPDRHDRQPSAGAIHDELKRVLHGLGEPVGATDLAAAMQRMFPETDDVAANKLRVDLLARAFDDATAASDPGRSVDDATVEATMRTRALPTSRRLKSEVRRLVYLVVPSRPGEDELFDEAVEGSAGVVQETQDRMRIATFGVGNVERASGHATRAALELRRASRLSGPVRVDACPPMIVRPAETKLVEGVVLDVPPELLASAWAMLADTQPGEVRLDPALTSELGREFTLLEHDGSVFVEGFRSRRDRDAVAIRQRAPLIGRRAVLQRLFAELLEAAEGRGSILHLVGEPGVGKSRLLAELRTHAAPRDFQFVHGRADDADRDRSFGALIDLVHDLCGIEPEDAPAQRFEKVERLRVLGLTRREVILAGETVGLAYPVARNERAGRPRGIELAVALEKAIRRLAQDRVVVLALEDLHWMDDATRQVLPLLVNSLIPGRVLVLLTRRAGAFGAEVASGRTIDVPPLDADATGRLLAHHLGCRAVEPDLAGWAHAQTGGVPLFVELLAPPLKERVAIEGEVARRRADDGDGPEVPDALRANVAARLSRLRGHERSMLRAAAALGGVADVTLLSAIEGLVGHTERAPLRRLWMKRLVVAEEEHAAPPETHGAWGGDESDERLPGRVRVCSELMRRAILDELSPIELERLHGRIVTTLERLGRADDLEGCEQLAFHAERSADHRRASDYRVRSAELSLSEGDPSRAAGHFAAAAALMRAERGDARDETAFALGLRAVHAALSAGAIDIAEAALAPLLAAGGAVQPALSVGRAIGVARCARARRDQAEVVRALSGVEEHIGEATASDRDAAIDLLACALMDLGENERALEVLDAYESDSAHALRARVLSRADRIREAEDSVNRALAWAARTGTPDARFAALVALAVVAEVKDEDTVAQRYREAAELAVAAGAQGEVSRLWVRAAAAAMWEGDERGATLGAAAAERALSGRPDDSDAVLIEAVQAALAIREHPDASYVPSIVRAVDRLTEIADPDAAVLGLEMLVHAHIALDDAGAAARTLVRASDLAASIGDAAAARRARERAARYGGG